MSAPSLPIPTARLITIRSRSPSARIFLRSPILTDAFSLTERAHDPLCTEFLPWIANPKTPITVESNTQQVRNWQKESLAGEGWFLVVCLLPEGRRALALEEDPTKDPMATIGDSGLGPFNLPEMKAETGIMINSGPLMRGKGYAVEALEMVFALGFDHLKLEKIEMGTHKDNLPMKSLMERKFGIPAVWNEKRSDWSFIVGQGWWQRRQEEKGDSKIVADIEDLADR